MHPQNPVPEKDGIRLHNFAPCFAPNPRAAELAASSWFGPSILIYRMARSGASRDGTIFLLYGSLVSAYLKCGTADLKFGRYKIGSPPSPLFFVAKMKDLKRDYISRKGVVYD